MSMEKNKIYAQNIFPNDKGYHDAPDKGESKCEEYYKRKCDKQVEYYESKFNTCCDDSCRDFYVNKIKETKEYWAAESARFCGKNCSNCPPEPPEPPGCTGATGPVGPVG
ncbi:MAG: hypothetical protein K0R00_3626, partial [Herbinix sp.]|nr:hypothetical protein [Herbinix sp.]